MVKKRYIIIILLSMHIGLAAQSRLSLCYRLDVIPQIECYYNSLDSILQTRLGDDYLFRFTAIPSFDPEYALQIELVEERYNLKVISFDKNLWYAKYAENINIDECSVELETEFAEQMLCLSRQFVDNKIDSVVIGGAVDGDLYQFEIKVDGETSCGQIRSPSSYCPLAIMCKLCAITKVFCITEKRSSNLKEEIGQQLFKLDMEVKECKTKKTEYDENN